MKFGIASGLAAVVLAGILVASPAQAKCKVYQTCINGVPVKTLTSTKIKGVKTVQVAAKKKRNVRVARRAPAVSQAQRQAVVALIKRMAPGYGVPTWFALRIAKVESGYNPRARGLAGEYGVFQMKCATARIVGYRGNCAGLFNASTNVQVGLKHLRLAVRSSRGNLKLAASKHNGGLGRKRLVRAYVRLVF